MTALSNNSITFYEPSMHYLLLLQLFGTIPFGKYHANFYIILLNHCIMRIKNKDMITVNRLYHNS